MGLAMVGGLVAVLVLMLLPGAADAKGKGKKVGHTLNVMTRNLYLGADLSPALQATTLNGAIDAAGKIVTQVHATKFPSELIEGSVPSPNPWKSALPTDTSLVVRATRSRT